MFPIANNDFCIEGAEPPNGCIAVEHSGDIRMSPKYFETVLQAKIEKIKK